jgi:hypothetical protein
MSAPTSWIPLRWPPAWVDPALLGLLEGTPFNCLVVEWDAALAPVIAKARAAGTALVAAGNQAQRAAAASAGLAVLPLAEQAKLPWKSPDPVLIASDCVWPGIARQASGAELSGPTANPWIDSNGWFLRLAKVRAPEKILWLMFEPPGPPNVVLLDSYLRALADTGAWGGRWVVSLDSDLRGGVARGNAQALESWKAISRAVAFFENRRPWTALEPLGVVGVISDFAGPNEVPGGEVLNLLGRRNLAYRILEKSRAETASLAGFRALISVDEGMPAAPLRNKLLAFARQGGLLLVGPDWKQAGGSPTGMDHPRVDVRRLGRGRLALCKTSSPDPFMIARDVHMLLGRTYDVARFFNLSAFLSSCTASPEGDREVVQVVSFAIRFPNDPATVWVPGEYASARLWSVGAGEPAAIRMVPENSGTSLYLPPVPVYAGIELSKNRH